MRKESDNNKKGMVADKTTMSFLVRLTETNKRASTQREPTKRTTTSKSGGGCNVSTFQSNKVQVKRESSCCEVKFSQQTQHKLPYHLDTKISEETVNRKGAESA